MTTVKKDTQNLIDNPQAVHATESCAQAAEQKSEQAENPNLKTVELDDPIKRGNTVIDSVDVRKPSAGELRGVSLMDVAQMDVLALRKVLPRITNPSLTDAEIGQLSLADMMQFGVIVSAFLLTKRQKADSGYLDA